MEIKQYTIKHLKELIENKRSTTREKLEAIGYLIEIEREFPGGKVDDE